MDESFEVEAKEYFTAVSGTCYQIRSNTTVPPSNFVHFELMFNDSLDPKDLPQVSKQYLFEIILIVFTYVHIFSF